MTKQNGNNTPIEKAADFVDSLSTGKALADAVSNFAGVDKAPKIENAGTRDSAISAGRAAGKASLAVEKYGNNLPSRANPQLPEGLVTRHRRMTAERLKKQVSERLAELNEKPMSPEEMRSIDEAVGNYPSVLSMTGSAIKKG